MFWTSPLSQCVSWRQLTIIFKYKLNFDQFYTKMFLIEEKHPVALNQVVNSQVQIVYNQE